MTTIISQSLFFSRRKPKSVLQTSTTLQIWPFLTTAQHHHRAPTIADKKIPKPKNRGATCRPLGYPKFLRYLFFFQFQSSERLVGTKVRRRRRSLSLSLSHFYLTKPLKQPRDSFRFRRRRRCLLLHCVHQLSSPRSLDLVSSFKSHVFHNPILLPSQGIVFSNIID